MVGQVVCKRGIRNAFHGAPTSSKHRNRVFWFLQTLLHIAAHTYTYNRAWSDMIYKVKKNTTKNNIKIHTLPFLLARHDCQGAPSHWKRTYYSCLGPVSSEILCWLRPPQSSLQPRASLFETSWVCFTAAAALIDLVTSNSHEVWHEKCLTMSGRNIHQSAYQNGGQDQIPLKKVHVISSNRALLGSPKNVKWGTE